MKILAIRIGDKYGPEYEKYLEKKLEQHHMAGEKKDQGWMGYAIKKCEIFDSHSVGNSWDMGLDQ